MFLKRRDKKLNPWEMTRCACTGRLVSVLSPEVMLSKYNLEFWKWGSLCCGSPLSYMWTGASSKIHPQNPNMKDLAVAETGGCVLSSGRRQDCRAPDTSCWVLFRGTLKAAEVWFKSNKNREKVFIDYINLQSFWPRSQPSSFPFFNKLKQKLLGKCSVILNL